MNQRRIRGVRHVERSRAMAHLTLDIGEPEHVCDCGPSGLLVARHVAADAIEIELLVVLDKRFVSFGMGRRFPEGGLFQMAGAAFFQAQIASLALFYGRRKLVFEDLTIVLVYALVVRDESPVHLRFDTQ